MRETDVEFRILINTGNDLLARIDESIRNPPTRFGSHEVADWFNGAKATLDRLVPSVGATLNRIQAPGIRSQDDVLYHRHLVMKMLSTLRAASESTGDAAASSLSVSSSVPLEYDVFISFSSRDQEDANLLAKHISAAGGRAFLSAKDLAGGDDFAERIRQALWASREVWVLVTKRSLKSEWVVTEWGAAWALEKRLVPILLGCEAEDLPERLRRLQTVPFHKAGDLAASRFRKSREPS